MMQIILSRLLFILIALQALSGCSSLASIGAGLGSMPMSRLKIYETPEQEIYRIDEQRYFTIKNYHDCLNGGEIRYYDNRKGIKSMLGRIALWPGFFRIDPDNTHIIFPGWGCGNTGCNLIMHYSLDGGRSFDRDFFMKFGIYEEKEKRNSVVMLKENAIYLSKIIWPYVASEISTYDIKVTLNKGEGKEKVTTFGTEIISSPEIHTPSGQERYQCDQSIHPTGPPINQN